MTVRMVTPVLPRGIAAFFKKMLDEIPYFGRGRKMQFKKVGENKNSNTLSTS